MGVVVVLLGLWDIMVKIVRLVLEIIDKERGVFEFFLGLVRVG